MPSVKHDACHCWRRSFRGRCEHSKPHAMPLLQNLRCAAIYEYIRCIFEG
ncbi:hypothetical protein DA2_2672 [Desulfovibrio sp. A2]|nr:hypothetical protein DA2_2672 [Desulfovibrio sp. A2]